MRERLIQSGYVSKDDNFTLEKLKEILIDRFDSINYEQAKSDVEPFIKDTQSLALWCADFFKQITDNLTVV